MIRFHVWMASFFFHLMLIIIIIGRQWCPVVGPRLQHAVSMLACLALSFARLCRSRICPGRLSTAWLVSLVLFCQYSCSVCYSSCGVSVHKNMSYAKRILVRNYPFLLSMLSSVAVNSLGEMVSHCLTPLVFLMCSLSLCRYFRNVYVQS